MLWSRSGSSIRPQLAALMWLATTAASIGSTEVLPLSEPGAEVLSLPPNFVPLESRDGFALLIDAVGLHTTFFPVAMNLETQMNQSFCAVATAATLLNALERQQAPVDPIYRPYRYFTQVDIFSSECAENVVREKWGLDVPSTPYMHYGMNLRQLQELLSCYAHAKTIHGADMTIDTFRRAVRHALQNTQFVGANINRASLGQPGGGHMSPIAAYNVMNDSMLFMDVARYKYPPAWVPVTLLYDSMNTVDISSEQTRGIVIVSSGDRRDRRDSTQTFAATNGIDELSRAYTLSSTNSAPLLKEHVQSPSAKERFFSASQLLMIVTVLACALFGLVIFTKANTQQRRMYAAL